jgi:hypothetical protein
VIEIIVGRWTMKLLLLCPDLREIGVTISDPVYPKIILFDISVKRLASISAMLFGHDI